MSGFVVTVDFTLKPGKMEAFRKLIDENAKLSCVREPGCRQFDVLVPRHGEDQVFLYEIYDSRAAFDEHLNSAHFVAFNASSADFIVNKNVAEFDLVFAGTGGERED
jgi:autoinducer 2-degrading protein